MTKIRGKIRMTTEFVEQLLGLPEEVAIVTFEYDPAREILTAVMASEEEVDGYTYDIGEGQEIPDASDEEFEIGLDMEAVRRTVELGMESIDTVEELLGNEIHIVREVLNSKEED
jgi:hypothetical protein